MIFVMMGTEIHPFDRLARAIDQLAASKNVDEEVFVQLGHCKYEPQSCRFTRFISFGEVCDNVRAASCVITHAGAGSTLVCIQQGKHPIMVPRRAAHKEHIDEHQVPFAEKLREAELATVVNEMDELGPAIAAVKARGASSAGLRPPRELTAWLEQFWRTLPSAR